MKTNKPQMATKERSLTDKRRYTNRIGGRLGNCEGVGCPALVVPGALISLTESVSAASLPFGCPGWAGRVLAVGRCPARAKFHGVEGDMKHRYDPGLKVEEFLFLVIVLAVLLAGLMQVGGG
jgi:hypothetical protein